MKRIHFILVILLWSISICAQNKYQSPYGDPNNFITYHPTYPARFPGGEDGLKKWLSENIRYPEEAIKMCLEGEIWISAVIGKDGSVEDCEIDKGQIHPLLDNEALRVVKQMPKWTPGKDQSNKIVRSKIWFPINFELPEDVKYKFQDISSESDRAARIMEFIETNDINVYESYDGLTLIQTDKSGNLTQNTFSVDPNTELYKSGYRLLACINYGNDNISWFIPQTENNAITGEPEILPFKIKRNFMSQEIYGDNKLINKQGHLWIINKSEFPFVIDLGPDSERYSSAYPIRSEKDLWWLVERILREHIKDYGKLIDRASDIIFYTIDGNDYKFFLPTKGDYKYGFALPAAREFYWFGDSSMGKRIYLGAFDGEDWIDIAPSDIIRDINKAGNILTINLNDNDYLKYTLYSHGIYEGKINRPDGVFELSSQFPNMTTVNGDFVFKKDVDVEYYKSRGKTCRIPSGSVLKDAKFRTDEALISKNAIPYVLNRTDRAPNGYIYDLSGEKTHYLSESWIEWKDAELVRAQEEEQALQRLEAKKKPVYDALVKRYGKKYVDAAMNGNIVVGMPIEMINTLFESSLFHNYGDTYKSYQVNVRPAIFIEEENIITGKGTAKLYNPFPTKMLVSVKNGRVFSYTYL